MDECWSAAQRMLSGHKRLCLECHDECLPKTDERPHGTPPISRPGTRW